MAIDLDSIISNASSVDDVVAALQGEQAATAKTNSQLDSLGAAASGTGVMNWLRDKMTGVSKTSTSPTSGPGSYSEYVKQQLEAGDDIQNRSDWAKEQEKKAKESASSKKTQG